MPELPEVETTRRGIAPHLVGRRVSGSTIRETRLRWPIPTASIDALVGRTITEVDRRAKYLLVRTEAGTLMLHLGMSGSLRVVPSATPATAHDHLDLHLDDGACLRLRDPRRFGSVHWLTGADAQHPLLAGLGPEPLSDGFDGDYLYQRSRGRRRAVKEFIMDGRIVAGIGNIYATEALHRAGIHPSRPAGRIGRQRYRRLARTVRSVLEAAIRHGGTTLRDFTTATGAPGYFRIELVAYGRSGEPCSYCGRALRAAKTGQRATVYCPRCQR